jgi:hypothetical protein
MIADPQGRSLRILRTALLVLVIFLLTAIAVWIANGSGGDDEETNTEAPAPRIVTPDELSEAATESDAPIYWAGERPGAELELSEPGEGAEGGLSRAYVRYLTGDAEAADPRPVYLAIGTYALPNAFAALQANARRTAAKLRRAPRGFRAWQDPASPTSVYLAKPGAEYQIEVYEPDSKRALAVALSGEIEPVEP